MPWVAHCVREQMCDHALLANPIGQVFCEAIPCRVTVYAGYLIEAEGLDSGNLLFTRAEITCVMFGRPGPSGVRVRVRCHGFGPVGVTLR
jgi:hypothetical protein